MKYVSQIDNGYHRCATQGGLPLGEQSDSPGLNPLGVEESVPNSSLKTAAAESLFRQTTLLLTHELSDAHTKHHTPHQKALWIGECLTNRPERVLHCRVWQNVSNVGWPKDTHCIAWGYHQIS